MVYARKKHGSASCYLIAPDNVAAFIRYETWAQGVVNCPCIHISGSVAGMRRDFGGYKCDVVRVGQWIYKAN